MDNPLTEQQQKNFEDQIIFEWRKAYREVQRSFEAQQLPGFDQPGSLVLAKLALHITSARYLPSMDSDFPLLQQVTAIACKLA